MFWKPIFDHYRSNMSNEQNIICIPFTARNNILKWMISHTYLKTINKSQKSNFFHMLLLIYSYFPCELFPLLTCDFKVTPVKFLLW